MDRKPADSNGRSYLQSPSGGLKPKKRADGAITAPSSVPGTRYALCLVTVASIRRHHQCLYCSHMKDYVANKPNFYVRVGLLEKMHFL